MSALVANEISCRQLPPSIRTTEDFSCAIVSTFPPKPCGLATFSSALLGGLRSAGVGEVNVVAVDPSSAHSVDLRVAGTLDPDSPSSILRALRVLNRHDVIFLQHEFGIFGLNDGESVLKLMSGLTVPIITTLHSVPLRPTPRQKSILEAVVSLSSLAVTMTAVARQRLVDMYEVDAARVVTIPHGATIPQKVGPMSAQPPMLLTWGLLGPGKGIEWVLEAIAMLKGKTPAFRYVVAGQTHPNVARQFGESYRQMLERLVSTNGLSSVVRFDATYRPLPSLLDLVSRSTCVVLPYESMGQITSGVLVDAIAAGKPVISTQFSHAVELLSGGAGILVPPADPLSMADAIQRVVSQPKLVTRMAKRAEKLAPSHSWSAVAHRYAMLAKRVSFEVESGVAS